jgi:hypothetical protein
MTDAGSKLDIFAWTSLRPQEYKMEDLRRSTNAGRETGEGVMWNEEKVAGQTTVGELYMENLLPDMATCVGFDPGPDPTWDPDEFPDDPREEA